MILLKPTAADRRLTAHLNRAYNQDLLVKCVVQLTSVEFTDAKDFRCVLFKFGHSAKISWVDVSSGYNHGILNVWFAIRMGFKFLALTWFQSVCAGVCLRLASAVQCVNFAFVFLDFHQL